MLWCWKFTKHGTQMCFYSIFQIATLTPIIQQQAKYLSLHLSLLKAASQFPPQTDITNGVIDKSRNKKAWEESLTEDGGGVTVRAVQISRFVIKKKKIKNHSTSIKDLEVTLSKTFMTTKYWYFYTMTQTLTIKPWGHLGLARCVGSCTTHNTQAWYTNLQ